MLGNGQMSSLEGKIHDELELKKGTGFFLICVMISTPLATTLTIPSVSKSLLWTISIIIKQS